MSAVTKAQYRAEFLAARRALPRAVRDEEAQRLCEHLAGVVGGVHTVCAFMPAGTEPGSPAMVDRLAALCDTVLLPVSRVGPGGEHLALQWGRYAAGTLVSGRFGIQEPPPPWLPADAVTSAGVVLVPALAVDRTGVRLGRGGGFYDRSLRMCRPHTLLVAVVRDDELVGELPGETHDVPVTHALTPSAGLVRLRE